MQAASSFICFHVLLDPTFASHVFRNVGVTCCCMIGYSAMLLLLYYVLFSSNRKLVRTRAKIVIRSSIYQTNCDTKLLAITESPPEAKEHTGSITPILAINYFCFLLQYVRSIKSPTLKVLRLQASHLWGVLCHWFLLQPVPWSLGRLMMVMNSFFCCLHSFFGYYPPCLP